MAETQLGKGHIFSLSGATLTCTALTNFTPNIQNAGLEHSAESVRIKGTNGAITGLVFVDDDELMLNFDLIPEGEMPTALAKAKTSAYMPSKGTAFGTTGFPVIKAGGFDDALNVTVSQPQPWIYMGGASWVGPVDGIWTMRVPLHRFRNITSGTAIT